ncbi:sigma-54-dependent transcriptional regulator [Luteimonas sp. R10]|uniref:sigma-54-dependent transcriptional regulator n=1 Tax=Luteimonas sp. R10 TaxID=3108176 RepID=UPI00308A01D7|nr:sigma-54 dependent transcriptional regulator [Luteimonas sp. R10]
MPPTVMILDDDPQFASSVADIAEIEGFRPYVVGSLAQAREAAARHSMDLMLVDLHLPDGSGLELIDSIDRGIHGDMAIVTGNPTIETAVGAVSAPVIDYLIKPFHPDRLIGLLRRCADRSASMSAANGARTPIPGVIAASEAMRVPVQLARRVASSEASILLDGETGTGKEVFARAIHQMSGCEGPFVAVNCGAMPPELLASQLFGHERGSFTGAVSRHVGVFEQAARGTLFLDEITEMPVEQQVYLLRVLETGVIRRLGSTDETPAPVRILAATNRCPHDAIARGKLREDLYYRLSDFTITLPPLRMRDDDAILLAEHFIDSFNARGDMQKRLSPAARRSLKRYTWPGNVRELRSATYRGCVLASGDDIMITPEQTRVAPPVESEDAIVFSIGTSWPEIERQTLLKVLAYCDNDKTAAARMLGVSVRTVHNHLAKMRNQQRRNAA